jgi:hypothetical protein
MSEIVSREVFVERTKMTANAFDRASTVAFTVGVFTPTAGVTFGINPFVEQLQATHVFIMVAWLMVALLLHWWARQTLKGIEI